MSVIDAIVRDITIMILLILKTYQLPLLLIGMALIFFFVGGCYAIIRLSLGQNERDHSDLLFGEDKLATQLDLARAYIELRNHDAAKKILKEVLAKGNHAHKQAARALLATQEAACASP